MIRNSIASVITFIAILGHALADEPGDANPRPDVWQLEFRGNKAFESESIRRVLATHAPVQMALSADDSTSRLGTAVCEAIQLGYRHSGFHDVRVSIGPSNDGLQPTIVINEGERRIKGGIRILGEASFDRQQLIEWLTTPHRLEHDAADRRVIWKRGDGVAFSTTADDARKKAVAFALESLGYRFADFDAQVVAQNDARTAWLEITIRDSGGRQKIDGVRITGLKRHTESEILDFLDLPDDLAANPDVLEEISHRTLRTGRFIRARTSVDPSFDADQAVPLNIALTEYDKVAPLSGKLTDRQQALAGLAGWLESWPEQPEDCKIVVNFDLQKKGKADGSDDASITLAGVTLPTSNVNNIRIELIVSNTQGVIAHLTAEGNLQQSIVDATVAVTTQRTQFASHRTKQQWRTDETSRGLQLTMTTEGIDPPIQGRRFSTVFGAGFGASFTRPVELKFRIVPAALFGMLDFENNSGVETADGSTRILFNFGWLGVDSATGRLRELHASVNDTQVSVRTDKNLFREALQALESETQDWPNRYESDHWFTSLVDFGLEEYSLLLPSSQSGQVTVLRRILKNEKTSRKIFQLATGSYFDSPFFIPSENPDRTSGIADTTFLHRVKGFLPRSSFEYRLIAATAAMFETGVVGNESQLFTQIAEDDRHGPVTCLLSGWLVPQFRPIAATKGLDRLDSQRLPDEVSGLLDTPCLIGDLVRNTVTAIRELSDDEAKLLAMAHFHTQSQLPILNVDIPFGAFTGIIDAIRNHPSDDQNEIARDALALAWKNGLHEVVRKLLEDFRNKAARPTGSVFRQASRQREQPGDTGDLSKYLNDALAPIEIPDPDEPVFSSP